MKIIHIHTPLHDREYIRKYLGEDKMNKDEIVKIKKSDLEALLNANDKAYKILDNISTSASEINEGIINAVSALEDCPSYIDYIIIKDDENSKEGEE